MKAAASVVECTAVPGLLMAMELSEKHWKLGFTIGMGQKMRQRTIRVEEREKLKQEVSRAKERFGLASSTPVFSCYEAGREGFWLHRYLESLGIENLVVDPGSMEVSRKKKGRRKTDGIDLGKLMRGLARFRDGDSKVWSVVRVPSVRAEDERQPHRELAELKAERTQVSNRIGSFLKLQGLKMRVAKDFVPRLEEVRLWNGEPLPPLVSERLKRLFAHWELISEQIAQLETERRAALEVKEEASVEKVRALLHVRAIGENASWNFVSELFAWRRFENRRQLGSLLGLTPTPFDSGDSDRELGIDKCGLHRVRSMLIQIAWCWVRYQPDSELTLWFKSRWQHGGKRARKRGIVALARKLIIALWRYVEFDVWPPGAVPKPAAELRRLGLVV